MRKVQPHLVLALPVLAAALLLALISPDPFWSDWGSEAADPVTAALEGDFARFMESGNAYIASLLLRLPLFLLVAEFGGGETAAFFASIVLALGLLAALTGWLLTRARGGGAGWRTVLLITFLTVANPVTGAALEYGHPEDILAATLMIAAVIASMRGRPGVAGILLGLAIVSKQWAVLALLPALAAAPQGRLRLLIGAVSIPAIVVLPFLLRDGNLIGAQQDVATSAGGIWRPHQVFWPLGVPDLLNISPGPTIAPSWLGGLSRILIVGVSIPLSAIWFISRRRGHGHREDVLLLIAVLMLFRCILDPWNIDYYHLPFVLTLCTWEVLRRPGVPLLTLVATAAVWFSFHTWFEFAEVYSDATYVMYMAWTLPLAFVLLRALFFPGLRLPALAGRGERNAQAVHPASR